MKTEKFILMAVMQVVAAFILNTQALAVVYTTTYSDGLTTGVYNPGVLTQTGASVSAIAVMPSPTSEGEWCWQVNIAVPYAFSYAGSIILPLVGETFNGGYIDQTFHDTTETHENWHGDYIGALLDSTYGALETWSDAYNNSLFHSEAAALLAGNTDLANALTVAAKAFNDDFYTQVTNAAFGHQNAVAVIQDIGGVDTWRSENPNWGQAAVNYANAITVNFAKTPGDAECIPEPATVCLLGLGGLLLRRRKSA